MNIDLLRRLLGRKAADAMEPAMRDAEAARLRCEEARLERLRETQRREAQHLVGGFIKS